MDKVVGRIPVLECLRAKKRPAHQLFLLRDARDLESIRRAATDIPIVELTRNELDGLARGLVHQGVILETDPLPLIRAEDWATRQFPADALVIVLDGIQDPQNFGAIVRSAAALGAQAVLLGKDRTAPLSAAAAKSAAGAMEHIDLVQATNLVRALDALKKAGFWVAALDVRGETDLWDANLAGRMALVVGSEGKGIRPLVRKHCDLGLRIPLASPITSLNASVSAGIAIGECLRQRRKHEDHSRGST